MMGGGPDEEHLLICLGSFSDEDNKAIEQLKKDHSYLKITPWPTNEKKEVPDDVWSSCTLLLTLFTLPSTPSKAPHLKWIQFFSAGTNHVQKHPIYTSTSIPLTTASGIHGPQISEWVLMTSLIQTHKYNPLYENQKKHNWEPKAISQYTMKDMVGQRLGVLGYGSIGRQVARVGKAMGMDVIAYTAHYKDTPEKRRDNGFIVPGTGDKEGEIPSAWYGGLEKEKLHEFLGQDIDILLVAVPLTDDTRHFLSTEEFEILSKKKALVSNISRGPIIDQPALVKALHDGKLRGACLDVTDPEPLPSDDPLWDAPNVTITPHISGRADAYSARVYQLLDQQLSRREKGEKMFNVVDRKRGY